MGCKKIAYLGKRAAIGGLQYRLKVYPDLTGAYKCPKCNRWHLTSRKGLQHKWTLEGLIQSLAQN